MHSRYSFTWNNLVNLLIHVLIRFGRIEYQSFMCFKVSNAKCPYLRVKQTLAQAFKQQHTGIESLFESAR